MPLLAIIRDAGIGPPVIDIWKRRRRDIVRAAHRTCQPRSTLQLPLSGYRPIATTMNLEVAAENFRERKNLYCNGRFEQVHDDAPLEGDMHRLRSWLGEAEPDVSRYPTSVFVVLAPIPG